jgi:hypothetical protein
MVTIDSLRLGQTYFIVVESNGCFHHSELFLTISRQTKGYFASFNMKGKIEGKKVKNNLRKRLLNEFHIDSIRKFERQLAFVSATKYNCTTVDEYDLSIGHLKKHFIVDDCGWEGLGKLVGYIFRKTE